MQRKSSLWKIYCTISDMKKSTFYSIISVLFALEACYAQDTIAPIDFEAARALTHERADVLKMAQAETAYREHESESLKSLHGPKITVDAKQVWGSKEVDLGVKEVSIPTLPITIPVPLYAKKDLDGPRTSVNLEWPLYTGGAISAKIDASKAAVYESRADERAKKDQLDCELATKYFAVQLARSIEQLRKDLLAHQEQELKKALRFEKVGTISKLERMSVQVSRDAAKREVISATANRAVAETSLKRFMREDNINDLTSPLFVLKDPLGDIDEWQMKAKSHSPLIQAIQAKRSQAEQGVKAAQAAWAPQLYAFATKNIIKHYLSITEPDWIAGVGVKFTLWSNKDRNDSIAAARSLVRKSDAALSETTNKLDETVETAYLNSVQTKLQYETTASTVELAHENLRLREKAFREGLATATEVNEARNQLTASEIARRVASYRFIVAWASLNAIAGTMDNFVQSISNSTNYIEK